MYNINYDKTDKKTIVEIYGIEFEIKRIGENLKEEIKNLKETDGIEGTYKYIDLLLGDKASEKINAKRISDGYEKLDYQNVIVILSFILEIYQKEVSNLTNLKNKTINNSRNMYNRRRRY